MADLLIGAAVLAVIIVVTWIWEALEEEADAGQLDKFGKGCIMDLVENSLSGKLLQEFFITTEKPKTRTSTIVGKGPRCHPNFWKPAR